MTAFCPPPRSSTGLAFPSLAKKVPEAPDAPENGRLSPIHAKTLSFFNASRTCSIDFGQFAPMFRPDAARYRNAIS
jgi:hypothetical protein